MTIPSTHSLSALSFLRSIGVLSCKTSPPPLSPLRHSSPLQHTVQQVSAPLVRKRDTLCASPVLTDRKETCAPPHCLHSCSCSLHLVCSGTWICKLPEPHFLQHERVPFCPICGLPGVPELGISREVSGGKELPSSLTVPVQVRGQCLVTDWRVYHSAAPFPTVFQQQTIQDVEVLRRGMLWLQLGAAEVQQEWRQIRQHGTDPSTSAEARLSVSTLGCRYTGTILWQKWLRALLQVLEDGLHVTETQDLLHQLVPQDGMTNTLKSFLQHGKLSQLPKILPHSTFAQVSMFSVGLFTHFLFCSDCTLKSALVPTPSWRRIPVKLISRSC